MNKFIKFTWVETKLFFRDPAAWLVALLLPTVILIILGLIPTLATPAEMFGGRRFIDAFVPSLVVITLATLGVNTLPIRLATYREKGVLRRLALAPVKPGMLLAAELVINFVMAVVAVGLLILVGKMVFNVALPAHLAGFVLTFLLGTSSLFSLGLLIAAVAPTNRTGSALALPLFFVVMFVGGAYLPRWLLPDFLNRIGEYTPPAVQTLLETWNGNAPQLLPLIIMAVTTLVAGGLAVRLFRWE